VVGVAELALILPYLTSADEIVAQGDVHQQIGLLRHADVADFEIGGAVALTREHPLVSGGETRVVTNALERPQDMVVCAGPMVSPRLASLERERCLYWINSKESPRASVTAGGLAMLLLPSSFACVRA
jgi:hypothetical protein